MSFGIIDDFYGRIQKEGFHTLSYFNVFEYGENVCGNETWNQFTLPACKAAHVQPSSTDAWANSSNFMASTFPKSLVTSFDTGGHAGYKNPPAGTRGVLGTWQGGIVVDPADPKLKAHFLAQLARKYNQIENFEGLVVDRSDWNSLYNFDFDDNVSFIQNKTAHLAQYSYVETIGALREMMNEKQSATKAGQTVMLQNVRFGYIFLSIHTHTRTRAHTHTHIYIYTHTNIYIHTYTEGNAHRFAILLLTLSIYFQPRDVIFFLSFFFSFFFFVSCLQKALGFAQLSLFKDFDGSFSEGAIVNAVGLLGARSTTILWTSNANECCRSAEVADSYFQRRLYMKVYPMAPFPQADHCIGLDPAAEAYYIFYGEMMTAIRGSKYLLKPHAVNVTANDKSSKTLVANAFEMPQSSRETGVASKAEGSAAYNGYGMLWPLMLGGGNKTSFATLGVAYLPPATTATSFEVMLPSANHAGWKAVPSSDVTFDAATSKATLTVPLFHGCALVRVNPSL